MDLQDLHSRLFEICNKNWDLALREFRSTERKKKSNLVSKPPPGVYQRYLKKGHKTDNPKKDEESSEFSQGLQMIFNVAAISPVLLIPMIPFIPLILLSHKDVYGRYTVFKLFQSHNLPWTLACSLITILIYQVLSYWHPPEMAFIYCVIALFAMVVAVVPARVMRDIQSPHINYQGWQSFLNTNLVQPLSEIESKTRQIKEQINSEMKSLEGEALLEAKANLKFCSRILQVTTILLDKFHAKLGEMDRIYKQYENSPTPYFGLHSINTEIHGVLYSTRKLLFSLEDYRSHL